MTAKVVAATDLPIADLSPRTRTIQDRASTMVAAIQVTMTHRTTKMTSVHPNGAGS
jgi:antitoxin (DNA-binding transcriptional repressor) of toxin-antitoxin stability system